MGTYDTPAGTPASPDVEDPPCEACGKHPLDCDCYDCPTCRGRGTVNPLTAPADFFCVGTTTCPHCDGHGECP